MLYLSILQSGPFLIQDLSPQCINGMLRVPLVKQELLTVLD